MGAGIGGGFNGSGSGITISGGEVTAKGGMQGAGIGGGIEGTGSGITISGGTVTATGGENGAGIGGGIAGTGSGITISGGTVTANGGGGGAGIGGGNEKSTSGITISGGTVIATGGRNAAGIGGGLGGSGSGITISGGTVTANGVNGGAGIGGGENGRGSDITISENAKVTAIGGGYAAGIGGGLRGSGSDIAISGGTVTANGTGGAAGIGGGYEGDGSGIEISGGSVKASSISVTPKDESGNEAYLLTVENPNSEAVTIGGENYLPVNHSALGDTNLYAYLPVGESGSRTTVKVGDVETVYTYDEGWKTCVSNPVLSESSSFTSSITVIMSCSTEGAAIYYTTDGSMPSTESLQYTDSGITITGTTTIKAIAVKDGMENSEIVSATYTQKSSSGSSGSSGGSYSPSTPSYEYEKPEPPIIKGDNDKEGWKIIKDEVADAPEGSEIHIDMRDNTLVPSDFLSDLKGKDVTVVLDMGNGVSWEINGKDITTDRPQSLDLGVSVGTKNIPIDIINNITGEKYSMQLSVEHIGQFGLTAYLTINLEAKNAGYYANLFHYNERTSEMDYITCSQIGQDGKAKLAFTHASDYAIVIDEVPHGTVEEPTTSEPTSEPTSESTSEPTSELTSEPSSEPTTSDPSTSTSEPTSNPEGSDNPNTGMMAGFAGIALAATITVVAAKRKKR